MYLPITCLDSVLQWDVILREQNALAKIAELALQNKNC